jgi:hypothetical protein
MDPFLNEARGQHVAKALEVHRTTLLLVILLMSLITIPLANILVLAL